MKSCSFLGHRNAHLDETQKQYLKLIIEDLIINNNVLFFLFGSHSKFNVLCHIIVTELKIKYPSIQRIAYTCKNETCILENEKHKFNYIINKFIKKKTHVLFYDKEYNHKTKYSSNKACYIERNQAMIDNSDFCIFYYNDNYIPKSNAKQNIRISHAKSGTKLAYIYAKRKGKNIINIF